MKYESILPQQQTWNLESEVTVVLKIKWVVSMSEGQGFESWFVPVNSAKQIRLPSFSSFENRLSHRLINCEVPSCVYSFMCVQSTPMAECFLTDCTAERSLSCVYYFMFI